MKISPTVLKETGRVAVGVLIGDLIMLLVFFLLKKLDITALLGALLGSAAAIGNFFAMGLGIQKALDDPERTKFLVQRSYTLRMLGMVAVMIAGFVLPCFHVVAVLVPFLLPGVSIHVMRLLGLYRPEKEEGGEST
ncbi:MAG: ATP synthase subunit I [Oscillospiraceae bacterium]|nr:ATP synthase subunit I [Oscillospiraceae bacterium]